MLRKTPTGTWIPAWVPESTATVSILLLVCSMVQSATGGYDGSMLNGLNILPSYVNYFHLDNPAFTGLNTASVFIGGFFGPIGAGVMTDRLGRRPAIFWGSVVTLLGILLQTAAQNIAMFVIARIILGWGGAISSVAGGVYLSETFASRYRAWGVGVSASLLSLVTRLYRKEREEGSLETDDLPFLLDPKQLLLRRRVDCRWSHSRHRPMGVHLGLAAAISSPRRLFDCLHSRAAIYS